MRELAPGFPGAALEVGSEGCVTLRQLRSDRCMETTQASDPPAELAELLAARDGDQAAGRELVSRHGASMIRTAWSVLGRYGGTEADDVVQEAFIAALTTSSLPTGDVGAWLRSITVRKSLDWLRQTKRRAERQPDESGSPRDPAASDNPGRRDDVIAIRAALARLSPADRAVLTLVDLEGHSMAEAAEALGATRVATKWRAVRARRRLAGLIGSRATRNEGDGS